MTKLNYNRLPSSRISPYTKTRNCCCNITTGYLFFFFLSKCSLLLKRKGTFSATYCVYLRMRRSPLVRYLVNQTFRSIHWEMYQHPRLKMIGNSLIIFQSTEFKQLMSYQMSFIAPLESTVFLSYHRASVFTTNSHISNTDFGLNISTFIGTTDCIRKYRLEKYCM